MNALATKFLSLGRHSFPRDHGIINVSHLLLTHSPVCNSWSQSEFNQPLPPLHGVIIVGFSDFAPIPAYFQNAPGCTLGIRMHLIPSLSVTRQPRRANTEEEHGEPQTPWS